MRGLKAVGALALATLLLLGGCNDRNASDEGFTDKVNAHLDDHPWPDTPFEVDDVVTWYSGAKVGEREARKAAEFANTCAWYTSIVERSDAGDTTALADALDFASTEIPEYASFTEDIGIKESMEESATNAASGDLTLIQSFLDVNSCSELVSP